MARVKPVIFVESIDELEKIAGQCDFDFCAYCCYCDMCIDGMRMWAYEENISSTPESLYNKIKGE